MKCKQLILTLIVASIFTPTLWADYVFSTFSHPNAKNITNAYDINNDGCVVGYYQDDAGKIRGYSFKDNVFTDTTYPGDLETNNHSINNNGQIAGYYYEEGSIAPFHGYIYEETTGFALQPYPGAVKEALHGINDQYETVGWAWLDSSFVSYHCAGGTFQNLSSGNGDSIYAEAINNKSVIVGGAYASSAFRGFVKDNDNWSYLEHPDADGYTTINGINDFGQFVGMYRTGTDYSSWQYHGFLYDQDGFTEITVPGVGVSNTICHGISNYGDIVGTYKNADGKTCGFVAVPEPATIFVLGIGAACLRRKK